MIPRKMRLNIKLFSKQNASHKKMTLFKGRIICVKIANANPTVINACKNYNSLNVFNLLFLIKRLLSKTDDVVSPHTNPIQIPEAPILSGNESI